MTGKGLFAAAIATLLILTVGINGEDDFSRVNNVMLHLSTLILQVNRFIIGFGVSPLLLPELRYDFTTQVCDDERKCTDYHEQMLLTGAGAAINVPESHQVTSDFQVSNFSYSIHVPVMFLESEEFQRIQTNLETKSQTIYSGLNLTVSNATFGVSADFAEDPDLGIQVSNVDVTLNLGELSMIIKTVTTVEDGEWTDLPSIHKDAAVEIMQLWNNVDQDENGKTYQQRYEAMVKAKINCFLSGGKSNEGCDKQEESAQPEKILEDILKYIQ